MLDRRIKFRHIECATTIARHGSLKAACAELNLTQPALSKTLKELEEILGARLMTRDRGGVNLTPEGEIFLEFAGQSLASLRRAVDGVSAIQRGGGETLHIGALPSVAARLMPQAITGFRTQSPDTRLHLRDGAHQVLISELRTGRLDLVIGRMGTPEGMQGLSFTQLYQEQVICVCAPDHPLASLRVISPEQLIKWPVLYPPDGAAIRPLLDRWCLAMGLGTFSDRIDCVSGSFGRNFLRHSQAIWFISQGVVAQDLADGRLVALPLDLRLTGGPVGLMTRHDAAPSHAQRTLMRCLVQTASDLDHSETRS